MSKTGPPGLGRPYRLVVVGDCNVGKTALIEHFVYGNHVVGKVYKPTIGDVYEACIESDRDKYENVQIFDTPGSLYTSESMQHRYEQDHFMSIADGFVLVYSITSRPSFDRIVNIRRMIAQKYKECPMVVVGSKADLEEERTHEAIYPAPWARAHNIRCFEVTVLDRETLKPPFAYVTWGMANPGKQSSWPGNNWGIKSPEGSLRMSLTSSSLVPRSPPADASYPSHGLLFSDCMQHK
ncbi:NF-kappa-B inhibitor-interacting Ras-like protein 2 isoform X1 [Dysidea avara]|uniref:NF-kappa-B inhibitor-interacting Ras-like protein 2 isoform X1 n=1 Tax=Dysidea avara TaxID=196820 RepID=UPI00332DE29B